MKRLAATLFMVLALVANTMGQGFGLQIAETAAPDKAGVARFTGGVTLGDDTTFFGGRIAYSLADGVMGFADLGWVDVDEWDGGPGLQVGGIFSLPLQQMPFNMALRGTVYKPFIDSDVSIVGFSLWGVISAPLSMGAPVKKGAAHKGVSIYGGVGFDHQRVTIDAGSHDVSDSNTDVGVSIGAIIYVNDQLSFYGELSHVDDPFFGGGIRLDF